VGDKNLSLRRAGFIEVFKASDVNERRYGEIVEEGHTFTFC
jgi:hypothetical protein